MRPVGLGPGRPGARLPAFDGARGGPAAVERVARPDELPPLLVDPDAQGGGAEPAAGLAAQHQPLRRLPQLDAQRVDGQHRRQLRPQLQRLSATEYDARLAGEQYAKWQQLAQRAEKSKHRVHCVW